MNCAKDSFIIWLVVSTHLKNISQIGSSPQIGMNIKNVWNHHPDHVLPSVFPTTAGGTSPFVSNRTNNAAISDFMMIFQPYLGVSLNGGTPKSSILIGFSITPIFGNHPFLEYEKGFKQNETTCDSSGSSTLDHPFFHIAWWQDGFDGLLSL